MMFTAGINAAFDKLWIRSVTGRWAAPWDKSALRLVAFAMNDIK
jgi:hypothetical protein